MSEESGVSGFEAGLMTPVLILVAVTVLLALIPFYNSLHVSVIYIYLFVALLLAVEVAINISAGLGGFGESYAAGKVIGYIIGLILFYGVVSSISKEAGLELIIVGIALFGSFGLSVYLHLTN